MYAAITNCVSIKIGDTATINSLYASENIKNSWLIDSQVLRSKKELVKILEIGDAVDSEKWPFQGRKYTHMETKNGKGPWRSHIIR